MPLKYETIGKIAAEPENIEDPSVPSAENSQAEEQTVYLKIVNSEIGRPVSGAAISYVDPQVPSNTVSVTTDESGEAQITCSVGTEIDLEISAEGYEDTTLTYTVQAEESPDNPAMISMNESAYDEPADISKDEWRFDFNGHSYCLVWDYRPSLSWDDARKSAKAAGGHLVTITSKEESEAIVDFCSHQSKIFEYVGTWFFMTGAYKNEGDSSWHWVTGEEFSYIDEIPADDDHIRINPEVENGMHIIMVRPYWAFISDGPDTLDGWYETNDIDESFKYDTLLYIIEWDNE